MQVCLLGKDDKGILVKSPRAWLRLSPPSRHGDPIPLAFAAGEPRGIDCSPLRKTYDGCVGLLQCRTSTSNSRQ